MTSKFTTNQAFGLYGLLLACITCFFMAGLYLGKESNPVGTDERETIGFPESAQPVGDVSNELDFYENLAEPVERDPISNPVSEVVTESPQIVIERGEGETFPETPRSQEMETSSSQLDSGRFTIQIAAHTTEDEARRTLVRLEAETFQGEIQRPNAATGDRYYRVWVGDFSSREEAERVEEQLKNRGFYTYIRRLDR